jgi:hypothetical protein
MRLLLVLAVLAVALLILGWLIRWFAQADPQKIRRLAKWGAAGAGGIVLVWLTVTRRLNAVLLLLGALLPLVVRWHALWQRVKAAAGPAPGRTSQIETRFLRMSLDHDTGVMSGTVLAGRFKGQRLDALSLDELLQLLNEYQAADEQSAAVLEAYLDRAHADWHERAGSTYESRQQDTSRDSPSRPGMTAQEAYEILGLKPGATPEQIKEAHQRLMQKLHPDRGGSTYLAAKINQAKDVLLGG